jgi:hypothetical protein
MANDLSSPTSPLDSFPGELVTALTLEAARHANLVASFLNALGFVPTPQAPIRWNADFLLELAAAMCLLDWEWSGLNIHRDAGLPSALDIVRNAFRNLAEGKMIPNGGELPRRVMILFVERFAWHARRDWNAAVTLGTLNEESALDALAEYLWTRRHAGHDR